MYEQLREVTAEAKAYGLAVVVWSYPRGSNLSKEGETAIDVVAYAAQIAAQMGANMIKVKPPSAYVELAEAKKVYEKYAIPTATLADRVRHVVQSAFNGKRIVIFSGGRGKGRRRGVRRTARHPRWRRLRFDHRAQFVPAPEGEGAGISRAGDGHLRGQDQVTCD